MHDTQVLPQIINHSSIDATRAFTVQISSDGGAADSRIETLLQDAGSGQVLGRSVLSFAEASPKMELRAFARAALQTGAYLEHFTVDPDASASATPVLLYATARQARVAGRITIVLDPRCDAAALRALGRFEPLPKVPILLGSRVDRVLSRAAEACNETGQPLLPTFLIREVIDTVNAFVAGIYQTGFFRAVQDGTLTREQYVYFLSQAHHYVRYTTRILGRCVAHAHTPELRSHFIKHLSGEINHELTIEKDLEYLGADPAYVREQMVPNTPTYQFLLAELSLISHFQDPLWLTAAPLAVEGMAAHLQPEFLEHLQAIVADWGMEDPCQATRFLSSHINFDGGDDGHWEGSVRLLGEYLIDEPTLRWFLAALGVCTEALERCYAAGVDDMALW